MTRRADHAHRAGSRTPRQRLAFAVECAAFLAVLALAAYALPLLWDSPMTR